MLLHLLFSVWGLLNLCLKAANANCEVRATLGVSFSQSVSLNLFCFAESIPQLMLRTRAFIVTTVKTPSWETPPQFEFLHQYFHGKAITRHTERTSPYNTLLVCTLCLVLPPHPLYSSCSSKAPFLAVAECKALNSDMEPSHTGWISEFTALTLQPRRGIQWKTSEAFQLGQSWGCCCAGWTGLCLRCCSAAICRAWLGCSSAILLIPLCSQQSQPRVKASLDARYMPKYADSHTMCSWPALVTGMLLTWHARDFVLVFL